MLREDLNGRLDTALDTSRIVVIQGLPRVGRSRGLRRWAESRDDVRPGSLAAGDQTSGVLLFDHLDRPGAERLVQQIRAAEASGEDTRFVVAPLDLAAAHHLRQSLAGSAQVIELAPLLLTEVQGEHAVLAAPSGPSTDLNAEPVSTNAAPFDPDRLWLRGGLPQSLEADTDLLSLAFRRRTLSDLLSRDYSDWQVPRAAPLDDILRWLANQNGAELDETSCPLAKKSDLRAALHVFEMLGLVRRLPNFPAGHAASFSRLQKVHLRDSGLLHAVLGIETVAQLRNHGDKGDSFESYAIEAMIRAADGLAIPQFFRGDIGHGWDELDLVLDFGPSIGRLVAMEFKVSANAGPRPGFFRARDHIQATDAFLVHSDASARTINDVERLDLNTALQRVRDIALR